MVILSEDNTKLFLIMQVWTVYLYLLRISDVIILKISLTKQDYLFGNTIFSFQLFYLFSYLMYLNTIIVYYPVHS